MFRNREDAARRLAQLLKARPLRDPLVLAIPRGGVVVGAVLARELGAELDVVLARKLRAPGQPELAIGAISEDGQVYLDPFTRAHFGVGAGAIEGYLAEERECQLAEITRRKQLFRAVRPPATVAGRSVIVTDDGIATGSTMIAALKVARAQWPHELIAAVPVGPQDRLEGVRPCCDDLVCLFSPEEFRAIGQFYRDFRQVKDEQVVELLRLRTPAAAVPRG
jgi:predicted phosphoribosyltransferase